MSTTPKDLIIAGAPVDKTVFLVAGIRCTVLGLDEVPTDAAELDVLWLLHARGDNAATMEPIGARAVREWSRRRAHRKAGDGKSKGLIAITFDQRNHGTRFMDKVANTTWREGNPRHAQDMFSIYQGTAQDTSHLLRHLPAYLPTHLQPLPKTHHLLGISLGAHVAWQLIASDPQIATAAIIIGCPDYRRLMLHRAEKSRLPSFSKGGAEGFLTSADFPEATRGQVAAADPAALLLPEYLQAPVKGGAVVRQADIPAVRAKLSQRLAGKSIFALSGAEDKLVPYACGEVFYGFLREAVEGWWGEGGCRFVEKVYPGVKHETTVEMVEDAVGFLIDRIAGGEGPRGGRRMSKL